MFCKRRCRSGLRRWLEWLVGFLGEQGACEDRCFSDRVTELASTRPLYIRDRDWVGGVVVVETMGVENPHPPFPHESLSFHDHAFRPPPILIFPRSRIKAFFSSQSPPSPPLPPLPPRPPWDNTTEHGVYKRMKPELGSVRISPENRRDPRDPRLATRKETSLSLLARFYYLLIVSERERDKR